MISHKQRMPLTHIPRRSERLNVAGGVYECRQACGVSNISVSSVQRYGGQAMPFDGVGFAFQDRVSKIDRVIDLLAVPDKWCQGYYKTPDGRHCIRGAIIAVEGANNLRPIVLRAIR